MFKIVAVLGTGSIGIRHLRLLRQIENVIPVAIPIRASRMPELAAQGYSVANNLSEAKAQRAIIATDTRRHMDDARLALSEGCHVLVEKPMAVDVVQALPLLMQGQSHERRLFVGCVLRFSESLNGFRAQLPNIGRVHSVRIESQSYLPDWQPHHSYRDAYSARADEGGVLRDLIHEIDYAGWIFGWPETVQGRIRNLGRLGIDAEECADLFWETKTGVAVSVTLDYLSRQARRRMRASGEHGTLEWDAITKTVTLALASQPITETVSTQSRDEMYLAQLQAFIQAQLESYDERLATGVDGVRALAVCDAARRASKARREEILEL